MPKLIELPDGRVIEFPDGMTDSQIDVNLRLSLAGEQGVNQAMGGASERNLQDRTPFAAAQRATAATMTDPEALGAGFLGATGPAAAAGTLGAATALADPVGVGKAALLGFSGTLLGRGAGKTLEGLGAPEGTANVTGLLGGLAGPVAGPAILSKIASMGGAGSRSGLISNVLARLGGASGAAAPAASKEALEIAAKKLALAESKEVARQAEKKAALEVAKERNALMARRIALQEERAAINPAGAKRPSKPATVAEPAAKATEGATALNPDATLPVGAAVAPPPAATSELILKIQQQMGTTKGRQAVREWLKTQPPELAAEIKAILAKGQAQPATVLGALFNPKKSAVGKIAKPGAELARLLGQIE